MKLLPILLLSLLASCVQSRVTRLSAYSAATALGGPEIPLVFYATEIDRTQLPAAVPIATVVVWCSDQIRLDSLVSHAAKDAAKLRADFILVGDQASFRTGTAVHSVGYGSAFAHATYGTSVNATAYRVAPAKMGFGTDTSGMINAISNKSLLAAGLLEGDTLVSINGVPASLDVRSRHYPMALALEPGDDIAIVWIRPGTGRMTGTGQALENPPTHLAMQVSFEPKARRAAPRSRAGGER